ncbi:MAG: sigma-70 family RNA polymerase sigma factor [Gaiellales bacterium]
MTMTTGVTVGAGMDVGRLHGEHYRSLLRLASVLVDDVGTCEELVQDAFVAVLARHRAFSDDAKAPAYLRSAVLNGARTNLRRQRVRRRARPLEVVGAARSAESDAVVAEEHRIVLAALRSLPERQREVLALRYYLDLSEAEIADTLGIAAGTVKTHAQRGLAALHQLLEDLK